MERSKSEEHHTKNEIRYNNLVSKSNGILLTRSRRLLDEEKSVDENLQCEKSPRDSVNVPKNQKKWYKKLLKRNS